MTVQITVNISDSIYEQTKQLAQQNQQTVDGIINEALARFLPSVAIHPQRDVMMQELAAFQAMKPQLLATYAEQYVAIYQGQVIDHDSNQKALVSRLDESHPQEIVLVKQVTSKPERVLQVRSPHLIRS